MELLRHAVVLIHIVGFAITFGSWVTAAFGDRRTTRLMDVGLGISLLTGLILAAPWPAGVEINYAKIAVKVMVLMVLGALIGIGNAQQRRTGNPAPAGLFWSIGALSLLNAGFAVLWR